MSIVGAFDVHRRQLTFEYPDTSSGELKRGRVVPADRQHLRAWLAGSPGRTMSTSRWRLHPGDMWPRTAPSGITPHLAEPADTAALRGKKRHAKTDKTDTRHLRVHLMAGVLPSLDPAGTCAGGTGRSAVQGPAR